VPRKIFGPKREVVRGQRRLHNEELHNLYTSPDVIIVIKARRMRWAEHVAHIGEMHTKFLLESLKGGDHLDEMGRAYSTHWRNAYKIFIGKPERRRPLGRPKHR